MNSESSASDRRLPVSGPVGCWRQRGLSGLLLIAVALTGCGMQDGPRRYAVSGRVLWCGAPLSDGIIRFIPLGEAGGPAAVTEVKDGVFSFPRNLGPVRGLQRVEIEAVNFEAFEMDDEAAYADHMRASGVPPMAVNPIPAIYNRESRLTAEIRGEETQELVFELLAQSG